MPWTFTVAGGEAEPTELLMLLWTTAGTASGLAAQVRARAGAGRTVTVAPGEGERFDVVAEQYRIEHGAR